MTSALLVNLGSPEMDRLAAELAARGALQGLVRRYVNKHRLWERLLATLPLMGGMYASTLGRRLPPAGLAAGDIIEQGVPADFAFALTSRVQRAVPGPFDAMARRLLRHTEESVARGARDHVHGGRVVVANYHVAQPAFEAARRSGIRTVLNYPIAHHRWQYRIYAEQARLRPQFAAALPRFGNEGAHAALLDREILLADEILVGSGFVKDTFVAEGIDPDRVSVVPYGADPDRFSAGADQRPRENRFRVLFVGQIGERKGISYLLDAYRSFQTADTELHLVGDFVAGAEVYRAQRGLFRHTGNVPQSMLPELMRQADVFVLPTLVEGMPMVVLEAMACGLPAIVSPHGPSEVVRDGIEGFVVPIRDAGAIADRLQRLKDDPALLARMRLAALSRSSEWTWQRYARRAADIVLR